MYQVSVDLVHRVEIDASIMRLAFYILCTYLIKLQNVFVQIVKCICPNCKMYLVDLGLMGVGIMRLSSPSCKGFYAAGSC